MGFDLEVSMGVGWISEMDALWLSAAGLMKNSNGSR